MRGLAAPGTSSETHPPKVPGEPGIWVVIFGDLLVFSVIFGTLLVTRAQDFESWAAAQRHLNVGVGVVYTLILLTSSLFVVRAMALMRAGDHQRAPRYVIMAMACGLAFAVIKVFEYAGKVHAGITMQTDSFYLFYFFVTGLHLAHVLLGMGLLTLMWFLARRAGTPAMGDSMRYAEGCACFWHMVDLLWLVIFALIYLVH